MDGFELHVHERRLHQYGQVFLLAMQKLFEGIQAFRHLLRWRRNKCCVPWPCASDPVLAFTEFTRTLLTSSSLGQENLVNFSYQPQRERKIPPEPAKSVIHRGHIIRNFLNVFQWDAGGLGAFE